MKFTSFDEIADNYIFLKKVISSLGEEYFLYMSKSEIKLEREAIINELTIDASFNLLAKFEAEIRTDYNQAIKAKKKDKLSKTYLQSCNELRNKRQKYDKSINEFCRRVRFDVILDRIKDYFKEADSLLHQECSNISEHLHFRHWYAHGRYFHRKARVPTPEDLAIACDEITSEVISRAYK